MGMQAVEDSFKPGRLNHPTPESKAGGANIPRLENSSQRATQKQPSHESPRVPEFPGNRAGMCVFPFLKVDFDRPRVRDNWEDVEDAHCPAL